MFFFFQAEDGIRDLYVTGVQTCALPIYALVIPAIDADASKDEKLLKTLREGIANLGPDFAKNSESTRIEVLKKFESSPFFQTMRLRTVQILYSSPLAYAYFGYEGEAFSKGGYLLRGFNDLRWLPEVPLEDSGPMPVGVTREEIRDGEH